MHLKGAGEREEVSLKVAEQDRRTVLFSPDLLLNFTNPLRR